MDSAIAHELRVPGAQPGLRPEEIPAAVEREMHGLRFIDVHTHLFMPSLGTLNLWGIDELITYHYLEAELFRFAALSPEQYWKLSKLEQADLIWKTLFVENSPVSEATRGVIAVPDALGLPTAGATLSEAREFFRNVDYSAHLRTVLDLAGVSDVVMTNDPLDPQEALLWNSGVERDPRFHPVLRLDRILNRWSGHWPALEASGYRVQAEATGNSAAEVRRFLADWCARMSPIYMAVSLPDTFQYPDQSVRSRLLAEAVLPACREHGIPLSLMLGVRYQVNPALRMAGDASGAADLGALQRLCAERPDNRFLVSVLSRENQHELCVYARKFSNLMPFGCWWFLNNPSIVEEITRERLEMLGASFIPQHSDARVLEQLIYKWRNTRRTLAPVLAERYCLLAGDGRSVTRDEIRRDIERLFRTNFTQFAGVSATPA